MPASSACSSNSITTDHISPAGAIKRDSPAGRYLTEHGVAPHDFNSYGSRRGNHEVMMRGTFANTRIKNQMLKGVEGGVTLHYPSVEAMSIYDAAMLYGQEGVPTVIFAGKEYGTGSSRDWAAKGPRLLGVRAVIAESFERIHRSNLIGMGILPLVFAEGMSWQSIELTGSGDRDLAGLGRHQARSVDRGGHHLWRRHEARRAVARPHRYVRRARLFPERRHSALRAARPRQRSRLAGVILQAEARAGRATPTMSGR